MLTAKIKSHPLDVPGQLLFYWVFSITLTVEMSSIPLHFKMVLFCGWIFYSLEWKNWFLSIFTFQLTQAGRKAGTDAMCRRDGDPS